MKRGVLKDTFVSDYTRAKFLNFYFHLNVIKKPNLKIWRSLKIHNTSLLS